MVAGLPESDSFASSAIPASEPITPADSIGIITNFSPATPYNEEGSDRLRIWNSQLNGPSAVYNARTNSWAQSDFTPWVTMQGTNWATTRLLRANFAWLQTDGLAVLGVPKLLGDAVAGFPLTYEAKVRALRSYTEGAVVSIAVAGPLLASLFLWAARGRQARGNLTPRA